VLANNKLAPASQNAFDSQFNKAIKSGVEKGEFLQPKGRSFLLSRTIQHPSPHIIALSSIIFVVVLFIAISAHPEIDCV
jgi:hypothetical protein